MHESGLYHGTLWASNILIAPGEGASERFFFSDPPRSVLCSRDIRGTGPARGDLLDLSHSVGELLGIPAAELPVADYGLSGLERARFLERLEGYRPAKLSRSLRRARALALR